MTEGLSDLLLDFKRDAVIEAVPHNPDAAGDGPRLPMGMAPGGPPVTLLGGRPGLAEAVAGVDAADACGGAVKPFLSGVRLVLQRLQPCQTRPDPLGLGDVEAEDGPVIHR